MWCNAMQYVIPPFVVMGKCKSGCQNACKITSLWYCVTGKCNAMQQIGIQLYAMQGNKIWYHIIRCKARQYGAILGNAVKDAVFINNKQCNEMWCKAMKYGAILCNAVKYVAFMNSKKCNVKQECEAMQQCSGGHELKLVKFCYFLFFYSALSLYNVCAHVFESGL